MNRLAELLTRAGRQFARKPAIYYGDTSLTFAEVEAASNRLASALSHALHVPKGARVCLLLSNTPAFIISDWALIKAGLVRVPINPRLAPPEIEHIVNDSGAAVLIYGAEYAGVVADLRANLPGVRHFIEVGGGAAAAAPGDGVLAWEDVLALGAPGSFAVATTMDDPYMILYTSGTTGRPKGALTTVRSRWVTLFYVYANEGFVSGSDVMLHVASLAHGSGTKVLPHYVKGAANVLLPTFTLESVCAAVQTHRVTTAWMVPTMVGMLLDCPERHRYDLSSLRTVVYVGAPMPAERLKEAIRAFGPIFVQVYGLSEAPQPALVLPKEDHVTDGTPEQMARLASAGRPCIGVDVRVVNDAGEPVPPGGGDVGEIQIRGEHLMVGYHGNPAATAEAFDGDWFRTGDLATVDGDGYVFIVDRMKDLIISGGYNVYPREVEEALYAHPAVRECAVIGVPDPKWGEAVVAVVALRPGASATAAEVMEHCRGLLASYKKPQSVDFMDDLPKGPTGKILKKALRDPYWASHGRRI